jgi:hypothetical protein
MVLAWSSHQPSPAWLVTPVRTPGVKVELAARLNLSLCMTVATIHEYTEGNHCDGQWPGAHLSLFFPLFAPNTLTARLGHTTTSFLFFFGSLGSTAHDVTSRVE